MTNNSPSNVTDREGIALPHSVRSGAESRRFGVYIHVPYCTVRCGYCDFNTYTATELRGTRREDFATLLGEELRMASEAMRAIDLPARSASTVFFGGGTPTLLPASDLAGMLDEVRTSWGISSGAEITTEANPDTVSYEYLVTLREAGFTRVSFGMQSAVKHVLETLDRTHDPEMIPQVVEWAKAAGLQVSLDLIYGTPGESLDDWRVSVEAALACQPDHLSAYALIVERGTKLHAQIRRGDVASVDDDLQAEMYELADSMLADAGLDWYEISNWSTDQSTRSRHNLAYWSGEDWWGAGPGAHSHMGGVRWWNVKHPAAYAGRISQRASPAHEREELTADQQRLERILLETRLADGLTTSLLDETGKQQIPALISEGLIDGRAALRGTVIPTRRGRLLADTVVHRLLGSIAEPA